VQPHGKREGAVFEVAAFRGPACVVIVVVIMVVDTGWNYLIRPCIRFLGLGFIVYVCYSGCTVNILLRYPYSLRPG
jgi:hypothetical protein